MEYAKNIFSISQTPTLSSSPQDNKAKSEFFSSGDSRLVAPGANRVVKTVGIQTSAGSPPFQWSAEQIENINSPDIEKILMPFEFNEKEDPSSPIQFIHIPDQYEENARHIMQNVETSFYEVGLHMKQGVNPVVLSKLIALKEQMNFLLEHIQERVQIRSIATQTDDEKKIWPPFPFCFPGSSSDRKKEATELDNIHYLQKCEQDLLNIEENIRIIKDIAHQLKMQFLFSISTVLTSLKRLSPDSSPLERDKAIGEKKSSSPKEKGKPLLSKSIEEGIEVIPKLLQSLKPIDTYRELLTEPFPLEVEALGIKQQTPEQIRLEMIKATLMKNGGFRGYIRHLREVSGTIRETIDKIRAQFREEHSSIKTSFSLGEMEEAKKAARPHNLRRRASASTLQHPSEFHGNKERSDLGS